MSDRSSGAAGLPTGPDIESMRRFNAQRRDESERDFQRIQSGIDQLREDINTSSIRKHQETQKELLALIAKLKLRLRANFTKEVKDKYRAEIKEARELLSRLAGGPAIRPPRPLSGSSGTGHKTVVLGTTGRGAGGIVSTTLR